jgi:hypothetical protein
MKPVQRKNSTLMVDKSDYSAFTSKKTTVKPKRKASVSQSR